jgi:hypothetical protein
MVRPERASSFGGIGELVIGEGGTIADSVRGSRASVEIHQRQEQRRVDPAAQQ